MGSPTGIEFCQVLPLEVLYPYSGYIRGQDRTELVSYVIFAMWSGDETARDTGTYRDWDAEAPIEFRNFLRANHNINLGNDWYKITSAVVNYDEPRVNLTLRRAGVAS
jgi:hypothetical protein